MCVCPLINEVFAAFKRPKCQPKEETSVCECCEWLQHATKQQPHGFCGEIPGKVPKISQGFFDNTIEMSDLGALVQFLTINVADCCHLL